MLKKLFFPALMLAGTTSFGQISFAPEVGMNMSSFTTKISGSGATLTENGQYQPGVRAGMVMDISLGSMFAVQPALYYNLVRTKDEMSFMGLSAETKTTIHALQLPVYFMYKSHDIGPGRIFAGIGPVFSLYLAGNTKSGSVSEDIKFGDDPDKDDMKSFDMGGSVNAGYEFSSGLFLRAYYNLGFANLAPGGDKDYSSKSNSFGISVGYFLGR